MNVDKINLAIIKHLRSGRFDLILIVLLKTDFGLLEFYTEEVSKLKDVQSVETFVVYKSYNLKIPYVID